MADFVFRAADPGGNIIKGRREASTLEELEYRLLNNGLQLLTAKEIRPNKLNSLLARLRFGNVSRGELIEFSNNVAVMIRAGVPLVTALKELREDSENGYFRVVLDAVIDSIQSGESLFKAMNRHRAVFPELYCNIAQIGENTGQLDMVFFELAKHYKRIEDMKKNTRKALIYPSFVMGAIVMVSLVFLGMVFPVFSSLFEEMEIKEYPLITTIFLGMSNSIKAYWAEIVIGLVLVLFLFYILRKMAYTKYYLDWLTLKLPGIRSFAILMQMAFFARYLATLQKAGVDILKSLDLANHAISNLVLRKQLRKSKADVESGAMLSDTLKGSRYFPNMVIRMISIGEVSGTLPEQLDYVAEHYDEVLERKIAVALTMLEPILIVLMAAFGFALIMAVLMPMYDMIDTVFSGYGAAAQ